MLRADATATADHAGTPRTPVLGPCQVTRRIEVFAQFVQAIVGSGFFGLRWEGVGIGTDGNLGVVSLDDRARDINGGADHLRLATVEQHRSHPQADCGFDGVGHRFTGAQARNVVDVLVLQGEGHPERPAVCRQMAMNGPHFGHGTLGFGQPQVNMRGQALEQRGQHLCHTLGLEQVGAVGPEQRR
ncbi:hypothetical protein D3C80_784650 [compost metagenome]